MTDDLDAMLLRLRAQHSEPVRQTWKSPIEARLVDDDDDEPEPVAVEPERDPYSPDPRLYSPEWLAEFDRRCAAAVAEMNAAIERARDGR